MRLILRYAKNMLEHSIALNKTEEYYKYALLAVGKETLPKPWPKDFDQCLKIASPRDAGDIIKKFVEIAREYLGYVDVSIISAIPLTEAQKLKVEEKVSTMLKKRISSMKTIIDPSVIGGLRVIAGNVVIDDTIEEKLNDMKKSIYKEVYFK